MLKQLFNFAAYDPARYPSSERTEWKGVFHFVFKDAGALAVRFKCMRMFPVGERTGNLNVAEIAAFFAVLVFRNPSPSKRPPPDA